MKLKFKKHTTQKGFTLLDVLIALIISSIAALSLAHAFTTHLDFNSLNERRSTAILAAQHLLDDIRASDITTLPSSGTEIREVEIFGKKFNVTVSYCKNSTHCTSKDVREIHCEVRQQKDGELLYEVDTVFVKLR